MKKTIALSLTSLLLMLSLGGAGQRTAYAQSLIELRGTVIDETNAYIAAATLTLEDAQGQKVSAVADDHGRYRFNVKPGVYTLTVEVEGFAKYVEQVDLTSKRTAP